MPQKQPTAAEQIAASAAMLKILAALSVDAEQYTLLEEPLLRKTFVKQELNFQIETLTGVLRTLAGPAQQEELALCPENATTSK